MEFSPILIPIILFIGLFTMIIFLRKYENEERMAMIEKGITPGIANKPKISPSGTLRFGLLAVGAGIGLLMGNFLEKALGLDEVIAYFSMVLLFGGGGLLVSYMVQMRQDEKEKREKQREIM